jgi:pentatricopeptide repeat protein
MKDSQIQPSSITYGVVIAACARVGDSYSAELLFTEMTSQRNFKPRSIKFSFNKIVYLIESLL